MDAGNACLWSELHALPIWAFGLGALSKPTRAFKASWGWPMAVIKDWTDFEAYEWPDLEEDDWWVFDKLAPELPEEVRNFMIHSHGGTLENLIELVGWEDLVFMMEDEPELAHALTEQNRLLPSGLL